MASSTPAPEHSKNPLLLEPAPTEAPKEQALTEDFQPVRQPDRPAPTPAPRETTLVAPEARPRLETVAPKEIEKQPLVKEEGFLDETINKLRATLRGKKKRPTTIIPQVRDELTVQIEHIMEDGLKDAYRELTPIQQQEFKIKGEATAWEIRALLRETKLKIKEIFKLLIAWLRLLPGVNRFFLEQEAKIKADKIFALRRQK